MAIAPLIVSIRTAGAAALARLGASFRRLGAEIRVAYARFALAGGIPGWLRRLPAHVRRASASFRALATSVGHAARALIMYALASRVAQAASDKLGKGLASMASTMALLGVKAGAALALLVPLVGITGNLLGAVQLVAPAIGAAALAFGTLKLATQGFGDALSAGLSGDTEEFNKALAKLPFHAQRAAMTLVDLRNEWKATQQRVQNSFFTGFREDAIAVSRALQPLADKWLPKIATSFATVRSQLAQGFAKFLQSTDGEAVFRNLSSAIDNLLRAVVPLARAFKDILYAAAPGFDQMSSSVLTLANRFAEWVRQARESGKLTEWLNKARETLAKLGTIAGNIVGIFQAMFKAGEDDGQNLLDRLISITEATERWLKSANGQTFLELFAMVSSGFAAIAPLFEVWIGYIRAVGVAWDFLKGVVSAFWDGLKAIFAAAVGSILGSLYMIIAGAAKAFGWIPGIGPKLKAAKSEFEAYARGVNAALDGIQDETVNITFRARKIGDFTYSGSQLSGSYSSGIGGRAAGGPMRPGVTYRINEQGQEFIQLGTAGRAYNARESAAMAGGGSGGAPSWNGSMTGLDAMFFRWFNHAVRTGKLKPA